MGVRQPREQKIYLYFQRIIQINQQTNNCIDLHRKY